MRCSTCSIVGFLLPWVVFLALNGMLGCTHLQKRDATSETVTVVEIMGERIELRQEQAPVRHMAPKEITAWTAMLLTIEKRVTQQLDSGNLNIHDLLVLRRRLNGMEFHARKHFASFPRVLSQDLKRVNRGLSQAILLLKQADEAEIRRVRVFAAKPPEEESAFGFRWPVTQIDPVISSPFGMRRHPILKKKMFHDGTDIVGQAGDLILACESGTVVFADFKGAAGNMVIIQHEDGWRSYYAHLQDTLALPGQEVDRGQPIGLMGSTGRSTGVHLHLKLEKDGQSMDPVPLMNARLNDPKVIRRLGYH